MLKEWDSTLSTEIIPPKNPDMYIHVIQLPENVPFQKLKYLIKKYRNSFEGHIYTYNAHVLCLQQFRSFSLCDLR